MATKKKPAPKKKAPASRKAKPTKRSSAAAAKPVYPSLPTPAATPAGSPIVKLIVGVVVVALLLIVMIIAKRPKAAAPAPAAPAAVSPAPPAVHAEDNAKISLPPIKPEGPKAPGHKAHREDANAPAVKAAAPKAEPKPAAPQAAAPAAPAMDAPKAKAADDDGARVVNAGKPLVVRAWRKAGDVASVDIFGAHNKPVAHLVSEAGAAGWQKLSWDGNDASGQAVAPGSYYVRASDPDLQDIRRVKIK